MARHRRQWSLDEKARIVAAVEAKVAEGSSIKAACSEHGIRDGHYFAWRRGAENARVFRENQKARKEARSTAAKKSAATRARNGHAHAEVASSIKASSNSRILPAWDVVNNRHFLAVTMNGDSVLLVPADDLTEAMAALAALRG